MHEISSKTEKFNTDMAGIILNTPIWSANSALTLTGTRHLATAPVRKPEMSNKNVDLINFATLCSKSC